MLYKGTDGIEREYKAIEFERFPFMVGGSHVVTLPHEWIKTGNIDPTKKLKILVLVPEKEVDSDEQDTSASAGNGENRV